MAWAVWLCVVSMAGMHGRMAWLTLRQCMAAWLGCKGRMAQEALGSPLARFVVRWLVHLKVRG